MQINLTKVKEKTLKILPWVFLAILIFFLWKEKKYNNEAMDNYKALQGVVSTYKLKNGDLVTSVNALTLNKKELKKLVLSKDKQLKELVGKFSKPKKVIKYVDQLKIDTVEAVYNDPIPCSFNKIGTIEKKWYKFDYTSTEKGFSVVNFEISDTIRIVTGTKRKWFLGKETETFDITHSNPYITTIQPQIIQVKERKKFWDTDLFKLGVGFIGGALITN